MGKNGAEIAKALVSPINKLIDCVKDACGKIYEPVHVKRMAKAEAFAINTIQGAIGSNPALAQKYNGGIIQIDNKELNGLAMRSAERSLYQEMLKQQNLECVVAKTYGLLDGEPDVPDEPVGQDWMSRFINSVETISDEDMQLLWAKVLAGEVKKPKSYSLRTLENLKNLSKEEALLFQDLSKYIIKKDDESTGYFVSEKELNTNKEFDLSQLLRLSDCGIINDMSFLSATYKFPPADKDGFHNNEIAIICKNVTAVEQSISFQIFPLTTFGNNLMTIMESETSTEYLIKFAKYLSRRSTYIEVKVHKILGGEEGSFCYDDQDLIAE